MLLASALGAQAPARTSKAPASVMDDVRSRWKGSTDYLARSAAAVPESSYTFRPTPAVRTFGELIAHVAGSQYSFCAAALGEAARSEDEIEKMAKTKAALVKALGESNAYCARAYAQSDAAVSRKMADDDDTRRSVLLLNMAHNFEHYGNVITYMRMLGMVPPSSQPAP